MTIRRASEHDHQVALFRWAELNHKRYPELSALYAIPNAGRRTLRMGASMRAEGLKAGVPDICLPARRGDCGALYIELKAPKGKVSELQRIWLSRLTALGNRAIVCYGWEDARDEIEEYLKLPRGT